MNIGLQYEAYKPDGVTMETYGVVNTQLWVVAYSLAGRNEESAKKLSEVHITIMQYSPLVLTCESSDYYGRILFPLVNELERKLRKLLYLAASISDNKKANEIIKQLEDIGFGEIFDLLFIDQNFISDMKKRINADSKSEFSGMGRYSKDEIESYLDSLVEHTLWDVILGENDVPTLRKRFRDVQFYRNVVMHARNIDNESFGKARYLFDKINKELNSAIGNHIGGSGGKPDERKQEVNKAIASAMVAMVLSPYLDALKDASALNISTQVSKVLAGMQPFSVDKAMSEIVRGIQFPTIQFLVGEAFKSIIQPLKGSLSIGEALKSVVANPSLLVMESFQRQINELTEATRLYQQQMVDGLNVSLLQDLNLKDESDYVGAENLETGSDD